MPSLPKVKPEVEPNNDVPHTVAASQALHALPAFASMCVHKSDKERNKKEKYVQMTWQDEHADGEDEHPHERVEESSLCRMPMTLPEVLALYQGIKERKIRGVIEVDQEEKGEENPTEVAYAWPREARRSLCCKASLDWMKDGTSRG